MNKENIFFTDSSQIGHKYTPTGETVKMATGGTVLLAPNGKPSNLTPEQYKLVRTPEFKAWFGDWENDPENASKVVDSNGEPCVVYHGTNSKFDIFNMQKLGTSQGRSPANMFGFYFSNDKSIAKSFGKYLLSCFLNIRNPKFKDIEGKDYSGAKDIVNEFISKIKSNDGAILLNYKDSGGNKLILGNQYIVPNSNQIKLADGTNTTFDSNNPDIRFEDGGQINSNSFMNWYSQWYKGISDKMNILFSFPSEIVPFKEKNVVILDVFEKIDQNINAKPYLNEITKKADEYGVTIYLEPTPRHKHFQDNLEKKKKITKGYLIEYYEKFGFQLTPNKQFMKRLPENNTDIRFENGGEIKGGTEVIYEDKGDTILFGSKNNKTRISVKGLSLEQIKEELEFEKDMLRFKKSNVANFSENEIRSQRGMTDKEKLEAIKMHKQSLLEIEKVEKIVIPFYESKLNYFAGGGNIDINEPFYVNGKNLAERVRILLKQLYPDYKWSVTSSYSNMNVYLLQADFDPLTEKWKEEHPDRELYYNVDDRDLRETNREDGNLTDRAIEVFKPIREYINKFVFNRNADDPYADYSNYNVYEYTYIGKWDKPYVQVAPKTSKTKKLARTQPQASTSPVVEYPFKEGDVLAFSEELKSLNKTPRYFVVNQVLKNNVLLLEYDEENVEQTLTNYSPESITKDFVKATVPLFKKGDLVATKENPTQTLKITGRVYNQQTALTFLSAEKKFLLSGLFWTYAMEDGSFKNEDDLVSSTQPIPENKFLDYLVANNERANEIPKKLELTNSLAMFLASAREVGGLDTKKYAGLLDELLSKFEKTKTDGSN